jgi:hypothetical protein
MRRAIRWIEHLMREAIRASSACTQEAISMPSELDRAPNEGGNQIEHLDPSRLTHDQTAPARDDVEGAAEGARYGAFATERRHMGT